MRTLDQSSIDALKAREGCRLEAYQDDGGVWSIGYGDTNNVKRGDKITQDEADARLQSRLVEFEQCVDSAVKVRLSDAQFGALVSFCYNVGTDAFLQSALLRKLNAGDFSSVPTEMLKWVNVNGVRDEGLVNRRNSEGGQWVKGAYVRGASITPDKPPAWHQRPIVRKIGAAIIAGGSGITSSSIQTARDAAQGAVSMWHGFGVVAGVLAAALILWALFDTRKT